MKIEEKQIPISIFVVLVFIDAVYDRKLLFGCELFRSLPEDACRSIHFPTTRWQGGLKSFAAQRLGWPWCCPREPCRLWLWQSTKKWGKILFGYNHGGSEENPTMIHSLMSLCESFVCTYRVRGPAISAKFQGQRIEADCNGSRGITSKMNEKPIWVYRGFVVWPVNRQTADNNWPRQIINNRCLGKSNTRQRLTGRQTITHTSRKSRDRQTWRPDGKVQVTKRQPEHFYIEAIQVL